MQAEATPKLAGPRLPLKSFTGHLSQAPLAADFFHQAHAGGL